MGESKHVKRGAPVVGGEIGCGDRTGGHGPVGQAERTADLGDGGADVQEVTVRARSRA